MAVPATPPAAAARAGSFPQAILLQLCNSPMRIGNVLRSVNRR